MTARFLPCAVSAAGLFVLASCGSGSTHREAMYAQFPAYPGATKVETERYEIRGDGRPTGEHGLRVTYQLPDDAKSVDVLSFYRENIPMDWQEASDATCATVLERMPAPPVPTTPNGASLPTNEPDPDAFVLMLRDSRLTVFAPVDDDAANGLVDGITFTLKRNSDSKFVVLDEPSYACGGMEPDLAARAFDE